MTTIHGDYGLACVLHSINGTHVNYFISIIIATHTHTVKYLNVLTRVVILRCPRDHHKAVWAAVATITQLERTPCAFRLLHLAGTIRSCQRKLVDHNRTQLREMIKSAPNPSECSLHQVQFLNLFKNSGETKVTGESGLNINERFYSASSLIHIFTFYCDIFI